MPGQDVVRVFLASASGRLGLALLGVLVAVSLYTLATYPLDYGRRVWYNPKVWADMPKNAPPAWVPGPRFPHQTIEARDPSMVVPAGERKSLFYQFIVYHQGAQSPSSLSLVVGDVAYHRAPPVFTLTLRRPDGREVLLYQFTARAPAAGESPPFHRYGDAPLRVLLSHDETVLTKTARFLEQEYGLPVAPSELRGHVEEALFGVSSGTPASLSFRPLAGTYQLILAAHLQDARDLIGEVQVVVGGTHYGLLGTDALGRDLAQGLLFGFPVALAIGVFTSVLTTLIGSTLGIISGFSSGRTDTLIQRTADVVTNIPLLPILIFLVFILGSRLWLVILLLVAFGWPGLTILTRSMVLQIRTGQLVEATLALGASPSRIMFRHIAFQIAPYLLAQMVFFVPGAILAEAALSFLGLGDPSMPTWGQILEQGFRTGAVYLGYWWWVLPPGLLIVGTAMTFILITLGLEPVVSPRLRAAR